MSISAQRNAIKHLLDTKNPADARETYYAFHHADDRTTLATYPAENSRAVGYVCYSRTGLDLFRPVATMRLPIDDMTLSGTILNQLVPPGASFLASVPKNYRPLLSAFFDINNEQEMMTLVLDRGRFEPTLNVLVTTDSGADGSPRYVIRRDGVAAASANVNWVSAEFAEIGVETRANYRRQGWGRSVTSGVVVYLLEQRKRPIYVVSADNVESIAMAEKVGFVDLGLRTSFLDLTRKPSS